MTDIDELGSSLVSAVNDAGLIQLLHDIVSIPSPTGSEEEVATYLHRHLTSLGIDSTLQCFADNRANVIAYIEGSGGGPTLMLNGHLDTSYTGLEPELSGPGYKNQPVIVDDEWMYGNGVHNMKNAVASYCAIAEAMVTSKARLRGDVVLAFVAGEIEKAPIASFQGAQYEGYGVGTSYALAHGLMADMCILGEPTTNTIGLSNMGVSWVRLSVTGTMAHTQAADTAINAIQQMRKVMAALDDWIPWYRDKYAFDGVRPACDITAIEGGWPYRASRIPVRCEAFLCIRTPPGVTPIALKRELRTFIDELNQADESLDVSLEFYVTHEGREIDRGHPLVQSLHAAHASVNGSPPEYRRRGAYMDSSQLIAHGIPTVVYGPSGRVRTKGKQAGWSPSEGEHLYLPDLLAGTRVVAKVVADICNRDSADVVTG